MQKSLIASVLPAEVPPQTVGVPFQKDLTVEILSDWWPKPAQVPKSISSLDGPTSVDVFEILEEIAVLTAPPEAYGLTTGETWAWKRYAPALDGMAPLRLRREWSELDPHQKMILSDDFGMGLPISLLRAALDIATIAPTNYVLKRAAIGNGPIAAWLRRNSRRGPGKSPDFIAIDKNDVVHVIECKGTQTSRLALLRQLEQGCAQKENVVFSQCKEGQRLVGGMFIPQFESTETAVVMIGDPPAHEPLEINLPFDRVVDIVTTGEVASTLRAAQLPTLASLVASGERAAALGSPEVHREIESLPLTAKDEHPRRATTQEFVWTPRSDGSRPSYRLTLEVGIEQEVIDLILNPKEDLAPLRKRALTRKYSDTHEVISTSPMGLYFRAGVRAG